MPLYNANSNRIFFLFSKIKCILFSTVNAVAPYPYVVRSSPRIKIPFLLLSTCKEELISTPKIIQFLPNPLPTENVPFLSNPIPYPVYLYLSISLFLVKVTALNKQFPRVG